MWDSSQLIVAKQFLISIVCFLGLFAGLLIAFFSKEEFLPGKKRIFQKQHLRLLQRIIFVLIVFFMFFDLKLMYFGIGFSIFFMIIFIFLKKDYHRLKYFFLAVFLFLSFFSDSIVVPVLVLFYGFPTAALFMIESKKPYFWINAFNLFVKYNLFVLILFVLFLVKLFLIP